MSVKISANAGFLDKANLGRGPYDRVMQFFDAPHDRQTIDLMARALDDAWAEAGFSVMGLSEDDWSEMADAISRAVAGGLRDGPRLEEIALEALHARREILTREVLASAMTFELGAALAGLPPTSEGVESAKEDECGQRSSASIDLAPRSGKMLA